MIREMSIIVGSKLCDCPLPRPIKVGLRLLDGDAVALWVRCKGCGSEVSTPSTKVAIVVQEEA